MKPGLVEWASNANYAGGGAVGQPTKAPAAAGQRADGYYPDTLVAPQIWNYERWAAMLKAHEAASTRILNWELTDVTAGFAGTTRGDAFYDGTTLTNLFTQVNAGGANTEANSVGGLIYAAGVAAVMAPGALPRVCHDNTGNMVLTSALPAILPMYRVGYGGAWATPGAWFLAGTWNTCAHDHAAGNWVFGDAATGNISNTLSSLAAMVGAGTQPGFGLATVDDIIHTHHPAALVYPDDPGNSVYAAIAIGGAGLSEWSTSVDGNVWTAATTPFVGIPRRLAYSAAGARFIACQRSNAYEYSDDNGVTWLMNTTPTSLLAGAVTMEDIACDGYGDWIIAQTDGTTVQVFASWDNGANFHHVFLTTAPSVTNICTWYGGGRFHLVVDDAAGTHIGFTSLRGGDV